MKYHKIATTYEPKITGKRDGAFTVEKNKKSFPSRELEIQFNGFFMENYTNQHKTYFDNYAIFEIPNNFSMTYYPRTKSIKELDFMTYGPYEFGIQYCISKKAYEIVCKYKLLVHNKIPVKIDTFNKTYFLLGFPTIESSEIDFDKSTFFNYNRKIITYKNYNDYQNAADSGECAFSKKMFLKNKLEYDIINTAKGIFFSKKLVKELNTNNITGYEIMEGILEN